MPAHPIPAPVMPIDSRLLDEEFDIFYVTPSRNLDIGKDMLLRSELGWDEFDDDMESL